MEDILKYNKTKRTIQKILTFFPGKTFRNAPGFQEGSSEGFSSFCCCSPLRQVFPRSVSYFLFLSCIFFAPLATSLPKQIDGAALLFVSVLFVRNITDIEWNDIGESAPAILAMIAMPLTYSISNGIALAFVSYALIRLLTGKASSTSPAIWVIAILSVISFAVS